MSAAPQAALPLLRRWLNLLARLPLLSAVHASTIAAVCIAILAGVAISSAQTCLSAPDMEPSVRSALEAAAHRYFEMSSHGDTASLRQNSIPLIASNFDGVETVVKDNEANFAGAQTNLRPPFLLSADGPNPLPRAEFLCGVFGPSGQTSQSAVFVLNNLPPGKYGVTILDVTGGKEPRALTLVLQQTPADWKLAGLYVSPSQAAGHDASWFAQRARDFKAKSQNHNAWLYYREAIALSAPVDFMSTLVTDKLYDEAQSIQPSDMPMNGSAVDLAAAGKTYRCTEIFPLGVADDVEVVVKYSSADTTNTQKTYQENAAVSRALIARFPELREAFAGVIARAVDPSGHDYGSMLPMKEIK